MVPEPPVLSWQVQAGLWASEAFSPEQMWSDHAHLGPAPGTPRHAPGLTRKEGQGLIQDWG